ncbi:uncharacterized protein C6orf132 homolog [Scleropages formosus]|uniref:uncharacterized protein C6orf132 homolog n=1 Tax=Scleropages formosus TaxID=113540 RepID=UPI000878E5E6|nr:uncharacterized protein C6orf132 homolog [Scleropages formosus]
MKRGTFHLLGTRKSPSLYDAPVQEVKETENVVLDLGSAAIPESGTARVKPRPTVKHHMASASSPDDLYGLAVPTPTVPLLPPANGATPAGKANMNMLRSGNSGLQAFDGQDIIPPPPPMEPPPPPPQKTPPAPVSFPYQPSVPPTWQPSSPKPQSISVIPPQKFLTDPSSTSASPSGSFMQSHGPASAKHGIVTPFSLPDLSMGQSQPTSPRIQKVPPPKPHRLSSISSQDGITQIPSPVPPSQDAAPSSFNPQNKAKLYNIAKTSLLSSQKDVEPKQKPILLLEESPSDPFVVQANNKAPTPIKGQELAARQIAPNKPAKSNAAEAQLQKDLADVTDNQMAPPPSGTREAQQFPLQDLASSVTSSNSSGATQPIPEHPSKLVEASPNSSYIMTQSSKRHRLEGGQKPYYHNRGSRATGLKEKTTSPMSLLLAAKEREKRKTFATSNKQAETSAIGEASFVGISLSDTSHLRSSSPSASTVYHVEDFPGQGESQDTGHSTPSPIPPWEEDAVDFIPPPPEFANSGEDIRDESPHCGPPPSLVPCPPPLCPAEISLSSLTLSAEPKQSTKVSSPNGQLEAPSAATSLSDSQKTLQSILQKKKLEMDERRTTGAEKWSQSQSDKDCDTSVGQRPTTVKENESNPRTLPSQAHSLVLSELESKISKKVLKTANSEPPSKQSYGMTFRVQPGSEQPVTMIRKGDSS